MVEKIETTDAKRRKRQPESPRHLAQVLSTPVNAYYSSQLINYQVIVILQCYSFYDCTCLMIVMFDDGDCET